MLAIHWLSFHWFTQRFPFPMEKFPLRGFGYYRDDEEGVFEMSVPSGTEVLGL